MEIQSLDLLVEHLYSINDISLNIALEKITEKLLEEGWSSNALIEEGDVK